MMAEVHSQMRRPGRPPAAPRDFHLGVFLAKKGESGRSSMASDSGATTSATPLSWRRTDARRVPSTASRCRGDSRGAATGVGRDDVRLAIVGVVGCSSVLALRAAAFD